MSENTLESLAARVTALEAALARLNQPVTGAPRQKDWRRTVGMFKDDEMMKEILDEARKIREAERQGMSE
jgi:cell division protein FtsB